MTVAGGRGSKSGELPIFVTSVQPHGCLSRDGRIKRGEQFRKIKYVLFASETTCMLLKQKPHYFIYNSSIEGVSPYSFRWCSAEYQWAGLNIPEPQWGRGHLEGQCCLALSPATSAGGQHGRRTWPWRAAASHSWQWLWCQLVPLMGHVAGPAQVNIQRRRRTTLANYHNSTYKCTIIMMYCLDAELWPNVWIPLQTPTEWMRCYAQLLPFSS